MMIRSWRDPQFRKQLAAQGLAPAHPSGEDLAEDWSTGFTQEVGTTVTQSCGGTIHSAARCCC